jgi:hypothetical protein
MKPTLYSRPVLTPVLQSGGVVKEPEEVAVVPIPGEVVIPLPREVEIVIPLPGEVVVVKGMAHPPRVVVVIVVLVVVVFVPLILILRRIRELVGRAFLVSGTLLLIS